MFSEGKLSQFTLIEDLENLLVTISKTPLHIHQLQKEICDYCDNM